MPADFVWVIRLPTIHVASFNLLFNIKVCRHSIRCTWPECIDRVVFHPQCKLMSISAVLYTALLFCNQSAGHNMLVVGVMGPTVPCEEINVKHQGRCQYNVSYIVRERGDYCLMVKWGDEHVPGSPYHVVVQ